MAGLFNSRPSSGLLTVESVRQEKQGGETVGIGCNRLG